MNKRKAKTIAVISDLTYPACSPEDISNVSRYGSEPQHHVLAQALADRGHTIHWYAPRGSSPVEGNGCVFHPMNLYFGNTPEQETITTESLDGSRTEDLLEMDFVIDMSATAKNIQMIRLYFFYKKYCCYRNGFRSYSHPTVYPEDKHFVVPSKANQYEFSLGGHDAFVQPYGILPFYSPGFEPEYFDHFRKKTNGFVDAGEYWLFPHRITEEKGTDVVLRLAENYPNEKFVFASDTPMSVHMMHKTSVAKEIADKGLKNVRFVPIPFSPRHHYYKRELMRHAKGVLSPFHYPEYKEGFGLASAEAVACGTPIIITDSPSSRELWRHGQDGLIVEGYSGFSMALEHWNSYTFCPHNRYTVEDYAKGYEKIMTYYLEQDALERSKDIIDGMTIGR